jgi:hypothetical protein
LIDAVQEQTLVSIWTRCHAHFRRNVLEKTPEACREAMQALLDEVLKADSQPEAFRGFEETLAEETLAGERTRIVETSDGKTVDTYGLREEAGSALDVLENGLDLRTDWKRQPPCWRFCPSTAGGFDLQTWLSA